MSQAKFIWETIFALKLFFVWSQFLWPHHCFGSIFVLFLDYTNVNILYAALCVARIAKLCLKNSKENPSKWNIWNAYINGVLACPTTNHKRIDAFANDFFSSIFVLFVLVRLCPAVIKWNLCWCVRRRKLGQIVVWWTHFYYYIVFSYGIFGLFDRLASPIKLRCTLCAWC